MPKRIPGIQADKKISSQPITYDLEAVGNPASWHLSALESTLGNPVNAIGPRFDHRNGCRASAPPAGFEPATQRLRRQVRGTGARRPGMRFACKWAFLDTTEEVENGHDLPDSVPTRVPTQVRPQLRDNLGRSGPGSSTGESAGLLSQKLKVRILPGALPGACQACTPQRIRYIGSLATPSDPRQQAGPPSGGFGALRGRS